MRHQVATPDLAAAQRAGQQHGVVSSGQLRALGLTKSAIARRVRAGRLHAIHRGVYAVGHVSTSYEQTWMAAVLAGGDGAVLSHRSAAALWGLLRRTTGVVDISAAGTGGKAKRKGVRVHRSRTLNVSETTRRHSIPVTKPARTLADLRDSVSEQELRRAIRQASVLGLPLGPEIEADRTKSDLELDFLALCRRHDIPTPEVNVKIGCIEADFLWRDAGLVVETDGYAYHRGEIAFQDDHTRNLHFRLRGYEVLRLSEAQVNDEPAAIVDALRQRLNLPS